MYFLSFDGSTDRRLGPLFSSFGGGTWPVRRRASRRHQGPTALAHANPRGSPFFRFQNADLYCSPTGPGRASASGHSGLGGSARVGARRAFAGSLPTKGRVSPSPLAASLAAGGPHPALSVWVGGGRTLDVSAGPYPSACAGGGWTGSWCRRAPHSPRGCVGGARIAAGTPHPLQSQGGRGGVQPLLPAAKMVSCAPRGWVWG